VNEDYHQLIDNLEGIKLKKSCHEIEPVCQLIEKFKDNL